MNRYKIKLASRWVEVCERKWFDPLPMRVVVPERALRAREVLFPLLKRGMLILDARLWKDEFYYETELTQEEVQYLPGVISVVAVEQEA